MTLCLSTGCFWRTAGTRVETVHIAGEKFGNLVDGVELCFIGLEEFLGFEIDEKAAKFLRGMRLVSLHAPCRGVEYGKNRKSTQVMEKIMAINEKITLHHVTFHPNQVLDFGALEKPGVPACIENLADGENRRGWQRPEEIRGFLEKNPGLGFCFDVNHGMANGIDPKEFMRVLGNRISCVHLNATETIGKAEHNFVFNSSAAVRKKIEPVFSLAVPLIIEVDIEKEKVPLIGDEIKYARERMH